FAVPDNVVQGFRGARPDMLGEFESRLGTLKAPARILELHHSYRLNPELATAWGRIARRIPVAAGGAGRILVFDEGADAAPEASRNSPAASALPDDPEAPEIGDGEAAELDGAPATVPGSLEVLLVDSPIHEERLVAQRILEEHLIGRRPLESMAVILRNGSQVRSMAKYLAGAGIAVNTPPAETPLREEPAVRPLLDLMSLALAPGAPADPLLLQELLMSRYANASALDVRRLRQGLRRHEVAQGGNRSSAELL